MFISLFSMIVLVIGTPINNGLVVKLNRVYAKEDGKAKSFSTLFTEAPRELNPKANSGIISQAIFPQAVDLGTGCTNQYAKILFPSSSNGFNDSKWWAYTNFINIPIIEEHAQDYKIIVAKAPKKFKIGRSSEAMPVIVYIVFFYDEPDDHSIKMPDIYFVNKVNGLSLDRNDKVDPVLIVDSNRIVTGLKSDKVLKFVKFKNKLANYLSMP